MDEGAIGRAGIACQQPTVVRLDKADIRAVAHQGLVLGDVAGREFALLDRVLAEALVQGNCFQPGAVFGGAIEDVLRPQRIAAQLVDGRVSVLRPVIEQRQRTANSMGGKNAANRSCLRGQVNFGHHRESKFGEVHSSV